MNTDMHTEALRAHFRVFQSTVRKSGMHPVESTPGVKRVDEYVRASVLRPARIGGDRVEISLSARMTVEAANGIAQDSMVEQINKAIQEAGIDLSVEGARDAGLDLSPEATAKRISEFALGYRNAFDEIHVGESAETRITGFLSMIRGAIQEGFQHARQFLEG
ncbi:MAG: DUF5610 domain-containing protein, partial [bacterium]|nr:DUF5610 domain-containing protein [bacterium]